MSHMYEIANSGFCQTRTSGQNSEQTKLNWVQNLFKAMCRDCDIAAGCPL